MFMLSINKHLYKEKTMELGEKYAYSVYQTKSFSRSATMHYVTQAALSLTVKKLETKLGFDIFDRSKNPVCLTKAGELYMNYLSQIQKAEDDLNKQISSLHNQESSQQKLSVGGTSLLAYNLYPDVLSELSEIFPDVEVAINLGETFGYSTMFEKLNSEELDLLIAYACDSTRYAFVPLMQERYVIAVKNEHITSDELKSYALSRNDILSGKDFPDKLITNFELFSDIKFHRVAKTGIIWRDMQDFLSQCTFSQYYSCKTRKNDIAYKMMLNGLCAVVTTDYVISLFPERDDISYFLVKAQKSSRQAMLIYKKGKELTPALKEFIRIAQKLATIKK